MNVAVNSSCSLDASSFSPQKRLRSNSCGMSQAIDFLSPYVLSTTDSVGESPKKQEDVSLHSCNCMDGLLAFRKSIMVAYLPIREIHASGNRLPVAVKVLPHESCCVVHGRLPS